MEEEAVSEQYQYLNAIAFVDPKTDKYFLQVFCSPMIEVIDDLEGELVEDDFVIKYRFEASFPMSKCEKIKDLNTVYQYEGFGRELTNKKITKRYPIANEQ